MDIVERLTILLSCIDKDDEEMRGAWETVEDAADEIEWLRKELAKPVLVGRTQIEACPVTDSYWVYPIRNALKDDE